MSLAILVDGCRDGLQETASLGYLPILELVEEVVDLLPGPVAQTDFADHPVTLHPFQLQSSPDPRLGDGVVAADRADRLDPDVVAPEDTVGQVDHQPLNGGAADHADAAAREKNERHRDCGGEPTLELRCSKCGEEVGARDAEALPGPGVKAA